jgi:hypothetical protein
MKSIKKLERATGLEPARRGGPATGIEILRATLTLRPHKQPSYNVNYRRVGIHAHGYLISSVLVCAPRWWATSAHPTQNVIFAGRRGRLRYRRVGIHAHEYLIFVRFGLCSKMVGNKCPPYAERHICRPQGAVEVS